MRWRARCWKPGPGVSYVALRSVLLYWTIRGRRKSGHKTGASFPAPAHHNYNQKQYTCTDVPRKGATITDTTLRRFSSITAIVHQRVWDDGYQQDWGLIKYDCLIHFDTIALDDFEYLFSDCVHVHLSNGFWRQNNMQSSALNISSWDNNQPV